MMLLLIIILLCFVPMYCCDNEDEKDEINDLLDEIYSRVDDVRSVNHPDTMNEDVTKICKSVTSNCNDIFKLIYEAKEKVNKL